MFRVLAMLGCLMLGVAMAAPLEDQKQRTTDLVTAAPAARLFTVDPDPGMNASVQGTNTAIVMGIAYALFMFFTEPPTEEKSNYGYESPNYGYDSPYYGHESSSYASYARSLHTGNFAHIGNFAKALANDVGVFNTVLNSIDPVDMSFRFMEIENRACRKRTLCELSATPLIGKLVRYISPSISSLKDYQDAMTAGEALQDCALLFAECPANQYFSVRSM